MAAIPFIVGGLLAGGSGGKLLWDKYKRIPANVPYDIVICINSLTALSTSGWEIIVGEKVTCVDIQNVKSDDNRGVIVSVLGSYNRGKSFLLNQLCNINLPTGNLIHTEGISITAGRAETKNIIFIDTAGTDTAIPKDKLDDKKATEALLREIALHLCSHIIIVVNRLRATDQSYIQQVLKHSKTCTPNKDVIIIHNLMDIETRQDADEVIQNEVQHLFDAKLDTLKLQMKGQKMNVNFYRSIQNTVNIRHFIFAKHGSDAAKQWNKQSIDGIMNILQTATDYRRNLDVINEMISYVNSKLSHLFINTTENPERKFEIQKHVSKPFIVFSNRREMDNLDENPDELILSPKLLYDDAGYFIGISSMDNGQWQPLYNLYETTDTLHAIVEVAGFKKGDLKVTVIEEAIIIEGNRDDLKTLFANPIAQHEKIPIGQFKLQIPLHCKIDPELTTAQREEGFYKFTCPKKKASSKTFD